MIPRYSLAAGRVVSVKAAHAPLLGLIVSGPFHAGAPGEQWFVVPLVSGKTPARDESAVPSMPGCVAAAWSAQSIASSHLQGLEAFDIDAAEAALDRVIAVQEGAVHVGTSDARTAVLRTWFEAALASHPKDDADAKMLGDFMVRQFEFFALPCAHGYVSSQDLARLAQYVVRSGTYSMAAIKPAEDEDELNGHWTGEISMRVAPMKFRGTGSPLARAV